MSKTDIFILGMFSGVLIFMFGVWRNYKPPLIKLGGYKMKTITEDEIEKINNFAKFCKEKSLRIMFRPNGTFKVEHIAIDDH